MNIFLIQPLVIIFVFEALAEPLSCTNTSRRSGELFPDLHQSSRSDFGLGGGEMDIFIIQPLIIIFYSKLSPNLFRVNLLSKPPVSGQRSTDYPSNSV